MVLESARPLGAEADMQPLEDDCSLLSTLLDSVLRMEEGAEIAENIERIRALSHSASAMRFAGVQDAGEWLFRKLQAEIGAMSLDEALPLIRATASYLNLTGIAEQHHLVRMDRAAHGPARSALSAEAVFQQLIAQGMDPEALFKAVSEQHGEIVLTAHPTQVNRRTLQYKFTRLAAHLDRHDRPDLPAADRQALIEEMVRELLSLWQTDELRRRKPSPLDEARGGLHIVEQSLWVALPAFLRRLSADLKAATGKALPLECSPVTFASWMGGDRDGNPNVTAGVTFNTVCLSRWMAADLYVREVDALRFELSMHRANAELTELAARLEGETAGIVASVVHAAAPASPSAAGALTPHRTVSVHRTTSVNLAATRTDSDARPPAGMVVGPVSFSSADDAAPRVPLMAEADPLRWREIQAALDAEQPASPPLTAAAKKAPAAAGGAKRPGPPSRHTSVENLLHAAAAGSGETPYRTVLAEVRRRLVATRRRMEELLAGAVVSPDEVYEDAAELLAPLRMIHRSLGDTGAALVADGRLTDLIRRIHCFGLCLMKLDIRQEAPRHTATLDALTRYLELGSYAAWPEPQRVAWLATELAGRRPLIPPAMVAAASADVREALETFRVAAELGTSSLGAYVISMASSASDVLAVELLQREARLLTASEAGAPPAGPPLRVVPLFETLADLEAGPAVMERLLAVPWYREHLRTAHGDHQEVMLGYSDSGKDAGRLAAAWALFVCQEKLVAVAKAAGVRLTLFHGRGGSIGRGGGPMHVAIQSQPPGSVHGTLRLTEQGEMIQQKYGLPLVAQRGLESFTVAVLLATVSPPPPARKPEWDAAMHFMGDASCKAYRAMVVGNDAFMKFFQEARSVLPAWLGVGKAIAAAADAGLLPVLQDMYVNFPFFRSTIDLVEMVLTKADMRVARAYADALCTSAESRGVGVELEAQYDETIAAVLRVTAHAQLSEAAPQLQRLIRARAAHITILNLMQVEVLKRLRQEPGNARLRDALLVSINGIAAGMRNTG